MVDGRIAAGRILSRLLLLIKGIEDVAIEKRVQVIVGQGVELTVGSSIRVVSATGARREREQSDNGSMTHHGNASIL
jgi:hypothetical protein